MEKENKNNFDMTIGFYENCEIFITGGTGVVGKAIIEKLLRSCKVKKIYILLRSKRGVSHELRLAELKNSRIFDVLKKSKPKELDKIIAIPGDIMEDQLGISNKDLNQIKNIKVFFHSAASTRFNDSLKVVIRANLKSTFEALKIAESMKNLKIFLHVSTYFSNPYLKLVDDKVYPTVFDWRTALKILDLNDCDETLDIITNKVITNFPNTYIFSKHLGEKLVDDHRTKVPVAIYKPSIVIAALDEPEAGFTEAKTGVMGMVLIWGTGLLQVFKCNSTALDFTPLDIGTKALLLFTALRGQLPREKFSEATPVGKFSCLSMIHTPLNEYISLLTEAAYKYPLEKSFWLPNVTVTSCSFFYWLLVYCLQVIPAIFVDILLKLFGIKPFMMAIQRKMYLSKEALMFFILNENKSDGITDIYEMRRIAQGTELDIEKFFVYVKSKEKVKEYILNNYRGCRKFVHNEPDSSIERCKKILRVKIIAYNILRGIAGFFILRAIVRRAMNYLNEKEIIII